MHVMNNDSTEAWSTDLFKTALFKTYMQVFCIMLLKAMPVNHVNIICKVFLK